MKYLLVLCFVMGAVLADEKYTDKYDNINIKEIMENKRLLDKYYECMMDRGPCTTEGKELRDHIQDALETGCIKCTKIQEEKTSEAIRHLIEHEIAMWKELTGKYDPTFKYRKMYEQRARDAGIKIPDY